MTNTNKKVPAYTRGYFIIPVNTHEDAMVSLEINDAFMLDGADGLERSQQIYTVPDPVEIKRSILGYSSRLIVAIPLLYNNKGFSSVVFYCFTYTDFKSDPVLCALLYGRKNAPGLLKGCKGFNIFMFSEYSGHLLKKSDGSVLTAYRDTLDHYLTVNKAPNYGCAVECFLTEFSSFVKASTRWDKQKVDLIDEERHRYQVKTSVNTRSGGYSSSNGQIII